MKEFDLRKTVFFGCGGPAVFLSASLPSPDLMLSTKRSHGLELIFAGANWRLQAWNKMMSIQNVKN